MEENIEDISGFIIDVNFSSHEEMSEMSKLWELEQIQIEKGPFKGSIHGIHTPHIQISKTVRSHGVVVKGKTPANSYIFNYSNGVGEITQKGIPLTSTKLLILDDNDEIDFTSKSASYDVTIATEKAFFKNTYKALFGRPFTYNREHNIIELVNTKEHSIEYDLDRWRNYLTQNLDEWVNDSVLTEDIEKNIIETLISHLGTFKNYKLLSSEKNAIALRQYIEQYHDENITIKEICESLKISERSVRPSFKKIFGLNPKEYLSRYRLGNFRNSLIKNSANGHTISEICYSQGLFHTGRLSCEYKNMFGKLPSDILSKKNPDS
jgi:AraC-like DNA-binding protein